MAGVIYRIVCFATGEVYVGQTTNFMARKSKHFSRLRRNVHENKHLQNTYNKYGAGVFYIEVLEKDVPKDKINDREIHWIAHFDSFKKGFNHHLGGTTPPHTGIKCVWNGIEYPSIEAAARANNIGSTTMYKWLFGFRKSDPRYNVIFPKRDKETVWNGITYPSIAAAARANKVHPHSMRDRLKKGYSQDSDLVHWSAGFNKCSWNGIQFESAEHAARAVGVSGSTMRTWLKKGYSCDEDIKPRVLKQKAA